MTKSNTFFLVVIGVLCVLLLLNRCGSGNGKVSIKDSTILKIDTSYQDTTIYIPKYIPKETSISVPSKKYIDSFKVVDTVALDDYLSQRTYNDTIPIDSFGSKVTLEDVISKNKLQSRSATVVDKRPIITNTITTIKTVPPTRQVYIGGELTGNQNNLLNGANVVLMYKDRKDRVFQAKGGILNINNNFVSLFGVSTLWKIKLHN